MKVQSVMIPKGKFSFTQAIRWLKRYGFKYRKVDPIKNFFRFRQKPPRKHKEYRIKQLKNGVRLILEV